MHGTGAPVGCGASGVPVALYAVAVRVGAQPARAAGPAPSAVCVAISSAPTATTASHLHCQRRPLPHLPRPKPDVLTEFARSSRTSSLVAASGAGGDAEGPRRRVRAAPRV